MSAGAGAGRQGRQRDPTLPQPPTGRRRVVWLGPGFLWMISATGSGELLFTPRIGSRHGYSLLWALIAAVVLKWFINRAVGRYTVCTGADILVGIARMPGPRHWGVWALLVPQALVAVSVISGLAAASATALTLMLPGPIAVWTVVALGLSFVLVYWGRYATIERAAALLAILLAVLVVAAAVTVLKSPAELAVGLAPRLPPDVQVGEVLAWLGLALSGASGMTWYSFWLRTKRYGAAALAGERVEPASLAEEDRTRLRGWLRQLTLDNTVAVVGTLVIMLAFLVLGAELLRPRRTLPEEDRIARVLGELLGGVWGDLGFWVMVGAVLVGFWSTVLSSQDGFARMFSSGTHLLAGAYRAQGRWRDYRFLCRTYLVVLLTVLPLGLYLLVGEPVALLAIAGAIEAAQLPVLAGFVLHLNRRELPPGLRPSLVAMIGTAVSGVFFAVFAVVHVHGLLFR